MGITNKLLYDNYIITWRDVSKSSIHGKEISFQVKNSASKKLFKYRVIVSDTLIDYAINKNGFNGDSEKAIREITERTINEIKEMLRNNKYIIGKSYLKEYNTFSPFYR